MGLILHPRKLTHNLNEERENVLSKILGSNSLPLLVVVLIFIYYPLIGYLPNKFLNGSAGVCDVFQGQQRFFDGHGERSGTVFYAFVLHLLAPSVKDSLP